jgi:hypothetical protein
MRSGGKLWIQNGSVAASPSHGDANWNFVADKPLSGVLTSVPLAS